jgi:hypothetical protein
VNNYTRAAKGFFDLIDNPLCKFSRDGIESLVKNSPFLSNHISGPDFSLKNKNKKRTFEEIKSIDEVYEPTFEKRVIEKANNDPGETVRNLNYLLAVNPRAES